MRLISLEKKKSTQVFYALAGLLVVVMVLTLDQGDPVVAAAGFLVAIVSIYPLYFWLMGWSQGLPIWPVYAAANGVSAAFPMVQGAKALQGYSSGEILAGGMTFVGFFLLGTVVWLAMTGRRHKAPSDILMISRSNSEYFLFVFVVSGLLFYLNQIVGLVPLPGNTMQIVRGITSSLSTLGIFVLAYYDGQGLLSRSQSVWLAVFASLTALAGAAGLIMATAIIPVAMLLLGYALGSVRIPWRALAIAFCAAAILHPGKFGMRELYWGPERPPLTLDKLPGFYVDWFTLGFQHVGATIGLSQSIAEEDKVTSLFERSGSLHMLVLVQKKSPGEVPFLDGITYAPIPRLLVPRFLDDQKGISHAGNVLLSVNYGVQTLEGTRGTSVAWGLVPEAYANYGYFGVATLAVLLAAFYSMVTNFSANVPMTSLRFVLGLLIMSAATKADTMGVFVTTQFQGIVGVSLAALVLMRRQRNPFASQSETEKETGGWEMEVGSAKQPSTVQKTASDNEHGAGGIESGSDASGPKHLAADGGVVRTMPLKTPRRVAPWMPRRIRAAVLAQQAAAKANGTEGESSVGKEPHEPEAPKRPRQLAVPYQLYRRYRG